MTELNDKKSYGINIFRRIHHKKRKKVNDKDKENTSPRIILVGNPNVGKSVIFYYLTGKYANVSNYPGTTVELMSGTRNIENYSFNFIDTPGIYNLVPLSEDEKVTKKVIMEENPEAIIQVGDAKNLRRTLLFTFQLLELGIPIILILNMMDEAKSHNIEINLAGLSNELGIPVSGAVAVEKIGIDKIRKNILVVHKNKEQFNRKIIKYSDDIEKLIERIENNFKKNSIKTPISVRAITLNLLEGDQVVLDWINSNINLKIKEDILNSINSVKKSYTTSIVTVISGVREKEAENIINKYQITKEVKRDNKLKKDITLHKFFGPLISIGVLLLVFLFVGYVGAILIVDFLSTYIFDPYSSFMNVLITNLLSGVAEPWKTHLINLLSGDLGLLTAGPAWTIGLILPIVAIFFFSFAVLEDSGFLSRIAVNADRLSNKMGLNGKAIIPILLGLGCGTSAIMTTRILDTKKERFISSLLIALAIPCSAQLGIILGLLFQVGLQWALIVLIIVTGQLFIIGYLSNKFVHGEKSKFIIEIPPMRFPKLSNIGMKTWNRTKSFLAEAVPLFFIGILLISILNETNASIYINTFFTPITVYFLGLPQETAALWLLGVIRRDLGAATLFGSAEFANLTPIQYTVGTTLIILFIPCIAAILMMGKERGIKKTLLILVFIFFYSILISGLLNFILHLIFGW
ncbi:MAG: ferrous iron transport protein B [Candidatus Helarchaeota archaeon]